MREMDRLRAELDELRAQLVNLPVRHPPPETPPPTSRVGVVVCQGPCGEDDFDDNRYWVKIQRIANSDTDASARLVLGDGPQVKGNCEPASLETDRIVCVTNFGEANEQTHFARPGTPVVVFAERDSGNPGMTRYYTPFIDLEDNGQRCDDSSGSSGAGKCLCTFRCTFDCDTNSFGAVSLLSKTCGPAPANAGEWTIKARNGSQCVLEYVMVGGDCPPEGELYCPTPETFPDPPTTVDGCCESSGACDCPTKSITFVSAINSIECNEEGGITLDFETQTHTVYAPA